MKAADLPAGSVLAEASAAWYASHYRHTRDRRWYSTRGERLASGQYHDVWRSSNGGWYSDSEIDIRLAAGAGAVLRVGTASSGAVERIEALVVELTRQRNELVRERHELIRQRDDARGIAVRSGYFQNIKDCDYGDDDPDAEAVAIVARIRRTESDMDAVGTAPRKPTPEDLEAARQIVQDWGHK